MKNKSIKHETYIKRFSTAVALMVSISILQAQTIELSSLDGQNGFVVNGGDVSFEGSGLSVGTSGDINGDGVDDIIIGARFAKNPSGVQAGASYIIFGSSTNFPTSIDPSNLDGNNGFAVYGINSNDRFGESVGFAGDVNGDGIDDIIIGASLAERDTVTNAGACYVLFGRTTGFPATVDAATISGDTGFVIKGIAAEDRAGDAVSTAGDINGDGIDDILVGVRLANPNGFSSGAAYIVFGNDQVNGFPDPFSFSDLDGNNGFTLTSGETIRSRFGAAVNSAGDINDDGFNDVLIGTEITGPNFSGSAYVVFGGSAGFPSLMNLTNLKGTNGFVFHGVAANNQAGSSVSGVGDINGDSLDDFIVGAFGAGINGSNSGSSYVIFGSAETFPDVLNATALDGTNGFTVNGIGAGDRLGISVGGAGDVNNDGLDEIIIGASGVDANGEDNSGASYVLFGSNDVFASTINASDIGAGMGMVLNGVTAGDETGISVSTAGDVNNDGGGDVIVGAWRATPNGVISAGSSYVVFGLSDIIFIDGFE